jgi:putative ABC transport system ATP-binding protein
MQSPATQSSAMQSPLFELRNVVKTYVLGGEPVHALDGISMSVQQGEYLAIMGTSGSGKSTLMNIIGCLDLPTTGEYILDGKVVHQYDADELAGIRNRTIGFIFQQFNLLPQRTALSNVMLPLIYAGLPPDQRRQRAEEVLNLVGLSSRLHHRPSELSGGQQQRVSIARALANHPKLLLADEPTGALDSHTANDLMNLIDEFVQNGMTVILVTHDAETAKRAKRIIHVKDGKIVGESMKEPDSTGMEAQKL